MVPVLLTAHLLSVGDHRTTKMHLQSTCLVLTPGLFSEEELRMKNRAFLDSGPQLTNAKLSATLVLIENLGSA